MDSTDDRDYVAALHSFLTLFRYLRRYSRQVHESGQSGRRLSALRFLYDKGPQTMGALSEYLYINESSTTEIVAKLGELGFVERTRSRSDNRVVEVALTESGRRMAASIELGGIPLLRERLKGLGHGELVEIAAAFRRLNELLGLKEEDE